MLMWTNYYCLLNKYVWDSGIEAYTSRVDILIELL